MKIIGKSRPKRPTLYPEPNWRCWDIILDDRNCMTIGHPDGLLIARSHIDPSDLLEHPFYVSKEWELT